MGFFRGSVFRFSVSGSKVSVQCLGLRVEAQCLGFRTSVLGSVFGV